MMFTFVALFMGCCIVIGAGVLLRDAYLAWAKRRERAKREAQLKRYNIIAFKGTKERAR